MVGKRMEAACLKHISVATQLAEQMIQMADHGVAICDSDCCLLVYGAEIVHIESGGWPSTNPARLRTKLCRIKEAKKLKTNIAVAMFNKT